jgi:hypothetical protein
MFLAQPLYHVHQIPVFAVQLFYTFLIALKTSDADFVASREFMLVFFKVLGDFLRIVLIKEADRAYGG